MRDKQASSPPAVVADVAVDVTPLPTTVVYAATVFHSAAQKSHPPTRNFGHGKQNHFGLYTYTLFWVGVKGNKEAT